MFESGSPGSPLIATAPNTEPVATMPIGKNLHVVAATVRAETPLVPGKIYCYDATIVTTDATTTMQTLAQAITAPGGTPPAKPLAYDPHDFPSFALPPQDLNHLRLVHGSCRKPHGGTLKNAQTPTPDQLATLDGLIASSAGDPMERPHQLLLTGDQIYADDCDDKLLASLTDAGNVLLGWSGTGEILPSANSTTHAASALAPGTRFEVITNAGFTGDDRRSHLLLLGEFFAMYLFVWSDVLWNDTMTYDEFEKIVNATLAVHPTWKVQDTVRPGATLSATPGGTSVLRLDAPLVPKNELPDLATIDAWAHAQVTGSGLSNAQLGAAFDGDPSFTCSRLIAPRKLAPETAYLACVVPTYHAGVNAGLGLAVDPADAALAWDASVVAPFVLPSYYAFRFRTSPAGDFASLARKIVPVLVGSASGTRDVDMSAPGFGAAKSAGLVLGVEGALKVLGATTASWPGATQAPYQASLRTALAPPPAADPVVAPPTCGNAQTGSTLPPAGQPPVWMSDLNLDPRSRVVAGAGTQVVQAAREALAGAAWDQAGVIKRANALLARAVAGSLATRHLNSASDGSYLQMTAPLHARVALTLGGSSTTLRGAAAASALPPTSLSGAFRRLMRPRLPIGRQLPDTTFKLVARLNTAPASGSNALQMRAPAAAPRGMVAFEDVATTVHVAAFAAVPVRTQSGWNLTAELAAAEPVAQAPAGSQSSIDASAAKEAFQPTVLAKDPNLPALLKGTNNNVPPLIALPTNATDMATFSDRFGAVAKIAGTVLQVAAPTPATFVPLGGAAALTTTRAALAARLDPERTIAARAGARVPLRTTGDPLAGVRNAPSFPQAM